MQPCKTCRSSMIAQEASNSFSKIERLLQYHGSPTETVSDTAQLLGPMCDRCLRSAEDRAVAR